MANGDDPADRYSHRAPRERDHERPVGTLPDAVRGVSVSGSETQKGDIEHVDADTEREGRQRGLFGDDFRAGAGGSPDDSPGDPGGTLGTDGGRREQER